MVYLRIHVKLRLLPMAFRRPDGIGAVCLRTGRRSRAIQPTAAKLAPRERRGQTARQRGGAGIRERGR